MTLKELLGDAYKDDLTVEDIATVLKGINLNADKDEISRLKAANDKLSAENAAKKRELQQYMTDEQKKAAEKEEQVKLIVEQNKALLRERDIANHVKEFALQGYSEALALETATALADGDLAKVFANQKTFLAEHDKAVIAEQMKKTPAPAAGGGTGSTVIDYGKQIESAQSVGDYARVAALMRMQQEAELNKT